MERIRKLRAAILIAALWTAAISHAQTIPWTEFGVAGKRLDLVDDETIAIYAFRPDGLVVVTVGRKNGPVIGPLLHWRIEHGQLLISLDSEGPPNEALLLIAVNGDHVSAKNKAGKVVRFKVSKFP